ncbi:hypothetical protein D3C73_1345120 [compost metagenome]
MPIRGPQPCKVPSSKPLFTLITSALTLVSVVTAGRITAKESKILNASFPILITIIALLSQIIELKALTKLSVVIDMLLYILLSLLI